VALLRLWLASLGSFSNCCNNALDVLWGECRVEEKIGIVQPRIREFHDTSDRQWQLVKRDIMVFEDLSLSWESCGRINGQAGYSRQASRRTDVCSYHQDDKTGSWRRADWRTFWLPMPNMQGSFSL
jgi:hypothetical protein